MANDSVILYSSGAIVSSAQVMNSKTIQSGGDMRVSGGGTANNTTVNDDGNMTVYSRGTANITTINSGGHLYVESSGTANYTTVNGGISTYFARGVLQVAGGGTVNNTTVNAGGSMAVYSRGTANSTTVNSGGHLCIRSGGMANNTTVNAGELYISSGGTALKIKENGGYVDAEDGANVTFVSNTFEGLVLNTSATLHSGTTANSTTVNSGGSLCVESSGTANGTTVNSGGSFFVSRGGTAANITASRGAYLQLSVAPNTYIQGTSNGSAFEMKNAVLNHYTVNSYGALTVYSGGTANSTTVNSCGSLVVYSGGTADNTTVNNDGRLIVSVGTANRTTVNSGGTLFVRKGGKISGSLQITSGAIVSAFSGTRIDFTASDRTTKDKALINNLALIEGRDDAEYTITVKTNQESGTYRLADGASGFAKTVTVKTTADEILGALSVGGSLKTKYADYTLNLTDGKLTLNTAAVIQESPRVNFMQNGVSQILAWDAEQGKVGYMAADGNIAPGWQGVWEWSGEDASMWKVVGAGRFSGSAAEQDGVLLYNGYGNTFAAWTNLNDGSYGYVSLCHVDGNFQTKCIADFDNNGFDDVIIYDENGSVGIVSDAAAYHDVWHVDDPSANSWQLVGAGRFHGESDSIVFKNTSNNHLYLWDNNDLSFSTWDWSQTDIGGISDGWEVAAIGDFSGDGIDDIALINHNDNDAVFVWDNGDCSTSHYMGCLGSGFKIESVGDYNGDGKEDLLLREYNSGWGGVGYWASADASQWTDLNARIETNMESKFAIIA